MGLSGGEEQQPVSSDADDDDDDDDSDDDVELSDLVEPIESLRLLLRRVYLRTRHLSKRER